jgi:hypothetical protein
VTGHVVPLRFLMTRCTWLTVLRADQVGIHPTRYLGVRETKTVDAVEDPERVQDERSTP